MVLIIININYFTNLLQTLSSNKKIQHVNVCGKHLFFYCNLLSCFITWPVRLDSLFHIYTTVKTHTLLENFNNV